MGLCSHIALPFFPTKNHTDCPCIYSHLFPLCFSSFTPPISISSERVIPYCLLFPKGWAEPRHTTTTSPAIVQMAHIREWLRFFWISGCGLLGFFVFNIIILLLLLNSALRSLIVAVSVYGFGTVFLRTAWHAIIG